MKYVTFISLLSVSIFLLSSCKGCKTSSSCPKIKELYDNPDDFHGKEECLEGTVKGGTNLYVLKFYQLEDETGSIIVVTNGAVPNSGKKKQIYGKVNQYFKMPGKGSIMVIEEM